MVDFIIPQINLIFFFYCCQHTLTQNSELCGCHGNPSIIETCTGVSSTVSPTDSRDRQSAVDVQAAVTIVMADSDVQFLKRTNNR